MHPAADVLSLAQPGLDLKPVASASKLLPVDGALVYPAGGKPLDVPRNVTIYLNITAPSCQPISNVGNRLPDAVVLKKHYYFGYRPAKTGLYGEFDTRDWAAHLGMGNETHGFAIAGRETAGVQAWTCAVQ